MSQGEVPNFELHIGTSEIVDKPLEQLPYPRPYEIIVDAETWRDVYDHARSDLERELGGILIGEFYEFQGRKAVRVTGAVPAHGATSSAASLKFTFESWKQIEQSRPDNGAKIVGWYHTHPGLTAFYSETDRFSHATFFNLPWHVGLVIDPINEQHVFFRWEGDRIEKAEAFYLELVDGQPQSSSLEGALRRAVKEADRSEVRRLQEIRDILTSLTGTLSSARQPRPLEDLVSIILRARDLDASEVTRLRTWVAASQKWDAEPGATVALADLRQASSSHSRAGDHNGIAVGAGHLVQMVDDNWVHVHALQPGARQCRHVRSSIPVRTISLSERGQVYIVPAEATAGLYLLASVQELFGWGTVRTRRVNIPTGAWNAIGEIKHCLIARGQIYIRTNTGIHHFRHNDAIHPAQYLPVCSYGPKTFSYTAMDPTLTSWATDRRGNLLLLSAVRRTLHRYDHLTESWRTIVEDESLADAVSVCAGSIVTVLLGSGRELAQFAADDGMPMARRELDPALAGKCQQVFSDGFSGIYLVTAGEVLATA